MPVGDWMDEDAFLALGIGPWSVHASLMHDLRKAKAQNAPAPAEALFNPLMTNAMTASVIGGKRGPGRPQTRRVGTRPWQATGFKTKAEWEAYGSPDPRQ